MTARPPEAVSGASNEDDDVTLEVEAFLRRQRLEAVADYRGRRFASLSDEQLTADFVAANRRMVDSSCERASQALASDVHVLVITVERGERESTATSALPS